MSPPPRIVTIILARMDSSRLPGKALLEVKGRPLIDYVIARARKIPGTAATVVATTSRALDDVLADQARLRLTEVFRGASEDVAKRVLDCALLYNADYFIRINGDSTLLDYRLIGEGVALCRDGRADVVTNLVGRTFPYGIAVEIVRTSTFAQLYAIMQSREEREHVTQYIYKHPQGLNIIEMKSPSPELAAARLVVDTPEDLARFRKMVDLLGEAVDTACCDHSAGIALRIERELP